MFYDNKNLKNKDFNLSYLDTKPFQEAQDRVNHVIVDYCIIPYF